MHTENSVYCYNITCGNPELITETFSSDHFILKFSFSLLLYIVAPRGLRFIKNQAEDINSSNTMLSQTKYSLGFFSSPANLIHLRSCQMSSITERERERQRVNESNNQTYMKSGSWATESQREN